MFWYLLSDFLCVPYDPLITILYFYKTELLAPTNEESYHALHFYA